MLYNKALQRFLHQSALEFPWASQGGLQLVKSGLQASRDAGSKLQLSVLYVITAYELPIYMTNVSARFATRLLNSTLLPFLYLTRISSDFESA